MDYFAVKAVHQAAVALSFCGFVGRGVGAIAGAAWVRTRIARALPHAVDTVLLASALWLAWQLHVTPVSTPWLAAKVAGLVAYIALGIIALRPLTPRPLRAAAWIGALAVFAWIVSVALVKDPAGFLRTF